MKIFAVLIVGLALLVFQNCASDQSLLEDTASGESSDEISGKNLKNVIKNINQATEITLLPESWGIKIDLESGAVLGVSPLGVLNLDLDLDLGVDLSIDLNHCLSLEKLKAIHSFLDEEDVCHLEGEDSDSTFCTFAIIPPYIEIHYEDSSISLGAAKDGCRRNIIDLCERGREFEDLIKGLAIDDDFSICR